MVSEKHSYSYQCSETPVAESDLDHDCKKIWPADVVIEKTLVHLLPDQCKK